MRGMNLLTSERGITPGGPVQEFTNETCNKSHQHSEKERHPIRRNEIEICGIEKRIARTLEPTKRLDQMKIISVYQVRQWLNPQMPTRPATEQVGAGRRWRVYETVFMFIPYFSSVLQKLL